MTDAFAETIGPLIQHVITFRERVRQGEHPPIDSEKQRLLKLLEKAGKRARATPELSRDFTLAQYALIYWIDEVLINSKWTHAFAWRDAILEIDIFGPPRHAAEDFWRRADQAESQARAGKGKDPLETFYLCAALEFRGRLCLDDAGFIRWFERIHHVLGTSPPAMDSPGDDTGWGLRPLAGGRLLVGVSLLASLTAVVTVLSFIAAIHASH